MIEVIYKEEKQEAGVNESLFTIPRNIRQIGLANENYRIYIEDYVYTFLGRMASSDKVRESGRGCAAILTGEIKWSDGITYIFIQSALMAENMEAAADHIDFSEKVWADICEEQDKYFPEQEVVGWFFAQPQIPVAATDILARTHIKSFGGEKVLMLMEPVEREDAFFRYENGSLVRQRGYYIYYEKNPLMQAYMIDKNTEIRQTFQEEPGDEAVRNFRKIIKGKKQEEPQEAEESTSVFSYAATACLAVAVLVVGVNFYQNYNMVHEAGEETSQVSAVIQEDVRPKEPTNTPAVTKAAKSPGESGVEASDKTEYSGVETQTTGSSSIYREEADVRKARRRENMAGTEKEESYVQTKQGQKMKEQQNSSRDEGSTIESSATENNATENGNTENSITGNSITENSNTEENSAGTASAGVHESYVIRPGDTLYQISMARYGSMEEIEEICRLNGISPEEIIYPGQIIVLP